MTNLHTLQTEQVNPRTQNIDTYSCLDIAKTMNAEDALVAQAVQPELHAIAQIMSMAAARKQPSLPEPELARAVFYPQISESRSRG